MHITAKRFSEIMGELRNLTQMQRDVIVPSIAAEIASSKALPSLDAEQRMELDRMVAAATDPGRTYERLRAMSQHAGWFMGLRRGDLVRYRDQTWMAASDARELPMSGWVISLSRPDGEGVMNAEAILITPVLGDISDAARYCRLGYAHGMA